MTEYFKIINLIKNKNIYIGDNNLVINLKDINSNNFIVNDKIFNKKINDNIFFWVSGGGSILINNKYIFLVKRSSLCNVNPGKFSIFTGRANNVDELNNPELLIRELFEELIISKNNILYYPKCSRFQKIIDSVYLEIKESFYKGEKIKFLDLNLSYLPCENKKITIFNKLGKREFFLDYYINNMNDINVLFLLSAEIEIKGLFAFDGEHYKSKNGTIRYSREIYLYDIFTSLGRNIVNNSNKEFVNIQEKDLTEHCKYFINNIKNNI